MSETWRESTLGDLVNITIGRTPPRAQPQYWTDDLSRPFCTIADMSNGVIDPAREGVTEVAEVEGKAKRVPAGSLLMSFKLTIGRLGFAARDVFPNEAIAWLQPTTPDLTPSFLALYLSSQDLTEGSGRAVMGNTLNGPSLRAIRVSYPDLVEQRRIVDLMHVLDMHVVALRADQSALAEAWAGARREVLTPGTDWADVRLADVADVQLGRMLSKERSSGADLYPYIRNANVQWSGLDLSDLKVMSFPARERERYALRAGDVLACEGGDPGRCVLLREDLPGVYYQKAVHRIRTTQLDPAYLYHWLSECYVTDAIRDLCTNTTIAHLTAEKFRTLPVQFPPTREQQAAIARLLDGFSELQRRLSAELTALVGLRSALLAALMTGEIDVPTSYDALLPEPR